MSRRSVAILVCDLVLLLWIGGACAGSKDTRVSPEMEKLSMKQVTVEGIDIHYLDEGVGSPIVLVHGIPTSSFLWRHMIDDLSDHGRVIAPDLPGFGLSDPPPNGDYSIWSYARLLGSFLEALSVEGGTLVCHDFGGPVTLTYALRHPDRFDRLVVLDTFLYTELPDWGSFYRLAKVRPLGEIFLGLWGKSIARSGLEAGVVDKSRISDEVFERYYMPDGTPDKLNQTYLATLRIDPTQDLRFIESNLSTIRQPTLVVWGEGDAYLPVSLGERIHRDIAGSTMVTIPDCGHYVQEDEPERVTELIVDFVREEAEAGGPEAQSASSRMVQEGVIESRS